MSLLRRVAVALLTTLALVAPVAACGSDDHDEVYEPTAWGPSYGGQTYCGFVYSPAECTGHPGVPMQMPSAAPAASDLLATALWIHLLTYPSFYHSGFYYDRYVSRNSTVIVNRNTYIGQGQSFDRSHSADERRYNTNAQYKGPGGKTYVGDKYGSASKTNSVVTRKTAGGNAGNAHTVTDPGKRTTVDKPAAPPAKPAAPPAKPAAPAPVRRK